MAATFVVDAMRRLHAAHPAIRIVLTTGTEITSLTRREADLAVRTLKPTSPDLISRHLVKRSMALYAAPSYLARTGVPRTPEALREHRCLLFRHPKDGRHLRWGFVRDGLRFDADVSPALVSDDIDALAAMALAGGERFAVPAEPIEKVVDTTGAGDLFAAGFLHGQAKGLDVQASLRLGAVCAAEIIQHYGARPEADLKALAERTLG
jgi:DNA-binding transcriptional LysR family regulator